MFTIVEIALENIKRENFNSFSEYRAAQNKIINELCLYKVLTLDINLIDDKNYSYKILF
jgi:hypothetical protein